VNEPQRWIAASPAAPRNDGLNRTPATTRIVVSPNSPSSRTKLVFSRERSVAGGDPVLRVAPEAWPVSDPTVALIQATVTPQVVELDCRVTPGSSQ
jgi:hypothetical protein